MKGCGNPQPFFSCPAFLLIDVREGFQVIKDRKAGSYCGLFFGQCNKKTKFTDCICGGTL